ncbi:MAG: META domain-containing protein [Paracoccus sp. (in: a-proteobacteria)]|nr:META domain-containing protein [Paracoccus sp. (in: a-proteobacteria)]
MRLWVTTLLALAACAAEIPEGQRIDGIDWRLVEMDGAPWFDDVSLRIDGDRLSGVAPCNAYSGAQAATAPGFAAREIGVTRMACADPARNRAEALYISRLAGIEAMRRDGPRLVLTGPGTAMVFERREARRDEVF